MSSGSVKLVVGMLYIEFIVRILKICLCPVFSLMLKSYFYSNVNVFTCFLALLRQHISYTCDMFYFTW